jgi:cupin superfamily acireductone dioxygenase involved in methionine salvage
MPPSTRGEEVTLYGGLQQSYNTHVYTHIHSDDNILYCILYHALFALRPKPLATHAFRITRTRATHSQRRDAR